MWNPGSALRDEFGIISMPETVVKRARIFKKTSFGMIQWDFLTRYMGGWDLELVLLELVMFFHGVSGVSFPLSDSSVMFRDES